MHRLIDLLLILTVTNGAPVPSPGQSEDAPELPQIAEYTAGMVRADGFIPIYRDEKGGTVLAEITPADSPQLYATGLSSGLGSNPVGLDRGQWGERTRLVEFRRVGRQIFLIEQNLNYRADRGAAAERQAVADSFANSVLWAGDVVAESADAVLVDLKSLLLRDAHSVVTTVEEARQGTFQLSQPLSFIELDRCRAFPRNTELNAVVTFTGKNPGELVRTAAAEGTSFSLRMHHSFIALPEPGYQPRRADPRVASLTLTFSDYSVPLDEPIEQRLILRHRLRKTDPNAASSAVVEPIVYYLDPGTPQPIRDALLEGAQWWTAAFAAAGFEDAFQVELLPDDVDPMDVRYNVIHWVHRRTRGWSYGQSVIDPRTGEIIKGHVLLGSLRVRQDRLLIDGLTSVSAPGRFNTLACDIGTFPGPEETLAWFAAAQDPIDVSLARLRQLSAHEVGHTIGFAHNFAASTWGDRASVMDYPAPRIGITPEGELDLSDAYATGVGIWDQFMVRYAYAEYPDERSEAVGLEALLQEAASRGMVYLSDADARPAGSANPRAILWDNGSDPVAELQHLMRVRRIAFTRFGDDDLLPHVPRSELAVAFVPVYLSHRYQVDAVARLIGGFDYDYAVAGRASKAVTPVPSAAQRRALEALLDTLTPEALMIPAEILAAMAPSPWRSVSDSERLESRTAMIFDPDTAAESAGTLVISAVLQPERLARLEFSGDSSWNLTRLLTTMESRLMAVSPDAPAARIQRILQVVFVRELMDLAGNPITSHAVRAAAADELNRLEVRLDESLQFTNDQGHTAQLLNDIRRFRDRPHSAAQPRRPAALPPGSPIGQRSSR